MYKVMKVVQQLCADYLFGRHLTSDSEISPYFKTSLTKHFDRSLQREVDTAYELYKCAVIMDFPISNCVQDESQYVISLPPQKNTLKRKETKVTTHLCS